jgi:cbb3-type cytochrome oxidase cytochrome c subunit
VQGLFVVSISSEVSYSLDFFAGIETHSQNFFAAFVLLGCLSPQGFVFRDECANCHSQAQREPGAQNVKPEINF